MMRLQAETFARTAIWCHDERRSQEAAALVAVQRSLFAIAHSPLRDRCLWVAHLCGTVPAAAEGDGTDQGTGRAIRDETGNQVAAATVWRELTGRDPSRSCRLR